MAKATRSATVFEFGLLFSNDGVVPPGGVAVPPTVFEWLELRSLSLSGEEHTPWIRPRLIRGRRAVQVVNYVGVIRACDDFHIEVLPKVGRDEVDGDGYARKLLLKMLVCLREFRHIQSAPADLAAEQMPLLEIFIAQFLASVRHVVQRGIRSKYQLTQDNLPALRGKLLMSSHIKQNLTRPDRFFTEHDEFNSNRAENRILRAALLAVLQTTESADNQRLARELNFVFVDVPPSVDKDRDFAEVARERGMDHYETALSWAKLILSDLTPASGKGDYRAPSLLYPMETVFEAFVSKHLGRQTRSGFTLRPHRVIEHLVHHRGKSMFRLKPDLSVLGVQSTCREASELSSLLARRPKRRRRSSTASAYTRLGTAIARLFWKPGPRLSKLRRYLSLSDSFTCCNSRSKRRPLRGQRPT